MALPPGKEKEFQSWYAGHARQQGLAPNPDDWEHFYDYRAAWKAGAAPDASGHWPSKFKRTGHPRRYIEGIDTITGQPVQRKESAMNELIKILTSWRTAAGRWASPRKKAPGKSPRKPGAAPAGKPAQGGDALARAKAAERRLLAAKRARERREAAARRAAAARKSQRK